MPVAVVELFPAVAHARPETPGALRPLPDGYDPRRLTIMRG